MITIKSYDPGKNYEYLGEVEITSNEQILEKVKLANSAKYQWSVTTLKNRLSKIKSIQNILNDNKERIANLITKETGKAITSSKFEVNMSIVLIQWFLDNAEEKLASQITYEDKNNINKMYYEAKGTAAVIIPWNSPLMGICLHIIPHLIVGNTVLLKPSEECILSSKLINDLILSSDLPKNVFFTIFGAGQQGEYLSKQNIDIISFVGSTNVGKNIYKTASEKIIPCCLELGGSAPGIVFDDVDIKSTAATVSDARFNNNGQICCGLKRLILHEKIADKFTTELVKTISQKKIGDPMNEDTDIGSLAAKRQVEKLKGQILDAKMKNGEIIECIDYELPEGAYHKPIIIKNISFDMKVWTEEVFGPVLPIITFSSEEEAIKLANDTVYGLGGYIYTNDLEKGSRIAARIQAGNVIINKSSALSFHNPFGGYKNSGIGRIMGTEPFKEYCNIKTVSIEKVSI